jgi:hypothetical protein
MELLAFICLVATLCAWQAWRKRFTNALALAVICGGLFLMVFLRGDPIDGIAAFAIWTLVSYLVLMFPLAAILFLVSAFCYILELQGSFAYYIQIASNLAGIAGVLAVWHGKPKWRYRIERGLGLGVDLSLADYTSGGYSVAVQANKGRTK